MNAWMNEFVVACLFSPSRKWTNEWMNEWMNESNDMKWNSWDQWMKWKEWIERVERLAATKPQVDKSLAEQRDHMSLCFFDLDREDQDLVAKYDSGKAERILRDLQAEKSPVYRGTHVEAFTWSHCFGLETIVSAERPDSLSLVLYLVQFACRLLCKYIKTSLPSSVFHSFSETCNCLQWLSLLPRDSLILVIACNGCQKHVLQHWYSWKYYYWYH